MACCRCRGLRFRASIMRWRRAGRGPGGGGGRAGCDLGGAADIAAEGSGSPLTGAFDVVARAVGRDMAAGVAELDNLLRGEATIDLSARRDTGGTQLRSLEIRASSLSVQASGKIASEGSDLAGEVAFADLGALGAC